MFNEVNMLGAALGGGGGRGGGEALLFSTPLV